MNLRQRIRKLFSLGRPHDPSVQPIAGYPSSIVDSYGCEFGFEMYYHIAYAYHLHRRGLLTKTISCRDTKCFYWFSDNHEERYQRRDWVAHYPCIAQTPHQTPDFSRWTVPDFRGHYRGQVDFGFQRPLLLVFNKYNGEWFGPPVNYLSKDQLVGLADWARDRYQMVYFRPTRKIVEDNSDVFDLDEKQTLSQMGVVMAESLHDKYSQLTFNEFQLCLLAQADQRIAVQGGATYLNALFPGDLLILHRRGEESERGTYEHFKRMAVDTVDVFDDDHQLIETLQRRNSNPDRDVA
ncbi:MAG: hypothetical protein HKN47_14140 [Pirellulaceae bacterium]|nr:hypothetical protein [Pirellulaceae bacterium]